MELNEAINLIRVVLDNQRMTVQEHERTHDALNVILKNLKDITLENLPFLQESPWTYST